MADCWVTAHIIDSPLAVDSGETYISVPQPALDDVQPLGVAAVLVTRAPESSGFDPGHQTMVLLEFDVNQVPKADNGRVHRIAVDAIERLQHHGVAPSGSPTEIASEFGDSMIETFQTQIDELS